ncbi:MAG: class I SAM-dependent methyltransferase [Actinomycetota bacterium]
MDNEWDAYADGWDDDPAARAYAAAAFDSLRRLIEASDTALTRASVLDFGCGTGLLTERLVEHGAVVVAVDTSGAMLDVVRAKVARHGWSTVTTATEPPTSAAPFDLVVCSSVCAFLDDYPATVAALTSLLAPGGVFVQWDWERAPGDDHGLTRDEIRRALEHAPLFDIDVDTAFTVEVGEHTMAPLMGHGRRALSG